MPAYFRPPCCRRGPTTSPGGPPLSGCHWVSLGPPRAARSCNPPLAVGCEAELPTATACARARGGPPTHAPFHCHPVWRRPLPCLRTPSHHGRGRPLLVLFVSAVTPDWLPTRLVSLAIADAAARTPAVRPTPRPCPALPREHARRDATVSRATRLPTTASAAATCASAVPPLGPTRRARPPPSPPHPATCRPPLLHRPRPPVGGRAINRAACSPLAGPALSAAARPYSPASLSPCACSRARYRLATALLATALLTSCPPTCSRRRCHYRFCRRSGCTGPCAGPPLPPTTGAAHRLCGLLASATRLPRCFHDPLRWLGRARGAVPPVVTVSPAATVRPAASASSKTASPAADWWWCAGCRRLFPHSLHPSLPPPLTWAKWRCLGRCDPPWL